MKPKVMILGADGYIGWLLAMYLSRQGYEVAAVDNLIKRLWESAVRGEPLFFRPSFQRRVKLWNDFGAGIPLVLPPGDILDVATNHEALNAFVESFGPSAIVHLAEQPSAPYSMKSRSRSVQTIQNNVIGTLNLLWAILNHAPGAHLIKLGTMGEYGTPNIEIEEGWIEVSHKGRTDKMLYPKRPGSFYHVSKVMDSTAIEFACRSWGLQSTDLNQGVVYGFETDESILDKGFVTSFHYDAVFGTALNRFIVQAVHGTPLTVYGKGGQTRGYLNIRDTLKCIELAIDNPPNGSECYRVFNQFTEQFSVNDLAERVVAVAETIGIKATIGSIPDPRVEAEEHFYKANNSALLALGLKPHVLSEDVLRRVLVQVAAHKENIDSDSLFPNISWRPPVESPSI